MWTDKEEIKSAPVDRQFMLQIYYHQLFDQFAVTDIDKEMQKQKLTNLPHDAYLRYL